MQVVRLRISVSPRNLHAKPATLTVLTKHAGSFRFPMYHLHFIFLVVTCDDTETPTNGNMMTTDEFNIGSTAIFSCSHGYMLTGGDRIRRCNESGDWTGAQPSCTRMPFLVIYIDRFVCSS